MYCDLQQLDDGQWFCPTCDPGQEHLLPLPAQRPCETHDPAATLDEQIDSALTNGLATYPRELIRRNLAICRTNACDRFTDDGNCLVLWRDCEHIRQWFEALCGYQRNRHWCQCWGKPPE